VEPTRRNRNIKHTLRNQWIWWMASLCAGSVLAAACGGAPEPPDSLSRSVAADVILSVTNHTPRRMIIYLRAGTTEDSLGIVAERSSRSFTLPSGRGGSDSLVFEARPARSTAGIRSESFLVTGGQQVLWTFDERGSKQVMTR
jgi:hypothetical protein